MYEVRKFPLSKVHHFLGSARVTSWSTRSLGAAIQALSAGGQPLEAREADTLFRIGDRVLVVELQRSYQHLLDYLRRQERYIKSGVECYWLTRRENFRALSASTGRTRRKREWGGKFPPGRDTLLPLLPDFPVAMLTFDDAVPTIQSPGLVRHSVDEWLRGIIEQRYFYDDGAWVIR